MEHHENGSAIAAATVAEQHCRDKGLSPDDHLPLCHNEAEAAQDASIGRLGLIPEGLGDQRNPGCNNDGQAGRDAALAVEASGTEVLLSAQPGMAMSALEFPAPDRTPCFLEDNLSVPSLMHLTPHTPPRSPETVNIGTPHWAGNASTPLKQSHPSPNSPQTSLDAEPAMTAEEETEQEDVQALAQAGDGGAIVVDHDEMDTDGGYESDAMSSATTTMSESVRDYAFENGRRYHSFREGRYNFPNDDIEQEREDMKHAMVKLLCQQLHFAPIGGNPQEIMDIGTGTGVWAIEMGDQYPSAQVLGVDLSPIQPAWLPPNVRFIVDDAESPWLYPRNHFDYIHSRHTVMAIKNWSRLFMRAIEHIRPGGWIEMQEIHHCPLSGPGGLPLTPSHPVAEYWSLINEGLTTLGVDFNAASGGRLADMMRASGFVDVRERTFTVPIGTWPRNKVLKTVGLYWRTILLDGVQAIALGPLTRGLGWSREQVELFLIGVRRAYHDNASLMYMPLHVVYGRKPGGAGTGGGS